MWDYIKIVIVGDTISIFVIKVIQINMTGGIVP